MLIFLHQLNDAFVFVSLNLPYPTLSQKNETIYQLLSFALNFFYLKR